jgi:ammonia channel protein AmtB
VISLILNKLGMLRVNVDEEDVGLDISEHHQEAYIYYSK